MVYINRLQEYAKVIADKMLLLFEPVTMSRKGKLLFKFARRKVLAKIETLCFELRIDQLVDLVQYVKSHFYDLKQAVNIFMAWTFNSVIEGQTELIEVYLMPRTRNDRVIPVAPVDRLIRRAGPLEGFIQCKRRIISDS